MRVFGVFGFWFLFLFEGVVDRRVSFSISLRFRAFGPNVRVFAREGCG